MSEETTLPRLPMRLGLVLLVLATSIGCDRATKVVAEQALDGRGQLSCCHDVLRLELARNTGAFLSLGANLDGALRMLLLEGLVGAVVVGLLAFALMRRRTWPQVIALSLVASGGLGNLWDRLSTGGVTDFMNLGVGRLRTGIFNVADLAIVAGLVMLLLLERRPKPAARPA